MFGVTTKHLTALIYEVLPCFAYEIENELSTFVTRALWLFFYLKNHNTQEVCAMMFRTSKRTYMDGVKKSMATFCLLDFIDFNDRKDHPCIEYCGFKLYACVDTTDVKVNYSSKWLKERKHVFSTKNHQYSVKFETATTLDGKIVWYYGPCFHDFADITIFRSRLRQELDPREQVFCDKGYIGEKTCLVPIKEYKQKKLTDDDIEHNQFVGHYRSIVENINADFKFWGILEHFCDEDLEFLSRSFRLICNIINIKRGNQDL